MWISCGQQFVKAFSHTRVSWHSHFPKSLKFMTQFTEAHYFHQITLSDFSWATTHQFNSKSSDLQLTVSVRWAHRFLLVFHLARLERLPLWPDIHLRSRSPRFTRSSFQGQLGLPPWLRYLMLPLSQAGNQPDTNRAPSASWSPHRWPYQS